MGYWSDLFGVDDGEVTIGMITGTEKPPKRKYGSQKDTEEDDESADISCIYCGQGDSVECQHCGAPLPNKD